jgi:hypothetical protein
MQALQVHTVNTITASDTNTHLLPLILSASVAGVNAAISAGVMKFDPPPNMILLIETTRSVYHGMTVTITQSSARRFLIPSLRVCEALPIRIVRPASLKRMGRGRHSQPGYNQEHSNSIESPCFGLEFGVEAGGCRHPDIK